MEGCVREVLAPQPTVSSATCLTAHMELQPDTKTSLSELIGGMYYPLWAEQDSLAVFTSVGQEPSAFTLIKGTGETTALFEGPISGDQYVALFPYNPDARWTENTLTFRLPQIQYFQRNSFALDGFPMVAVSETGDLNFKNLCSVVRLSIKGSGVIKSITLHSDTHYLSGTASVDLSYGDSPTLVMQDGGSHDVQLDCGAVILNGDTAKDFYIVVPSATYEGLTISIDAYTETVTKAISHEVTLNRSELRPVTPFMVEVPMIDLDHLPENQIWYKTLSGKAISLFDKDSPAFDATIMSNSYEEGYGIIAFNSPVTELKTNALRETDMTELHLPDCVTTIGMSALPTNLDAFRIPAKLTDLGEENLIYVGSVYGPLVAEDGRSVVADGKLLGVIDKGIDDYISPEGVRIVGRSCFWRTSFQTITLSEGIQEIEDYAFNGSTVKRIYFPQSVETIGLSQYMNLEGFFGSSHCTTEDHLCLISPRGSFGAELVGIVPDTSLEEYVIPDGVSSIGVTFTWQNLKSIRIPSSLIQKRVVNCFERCPKLERLEGEGVTEDGRCVIRNGCLFIACGKGLRDYTTPSGIVTIQGDCFAACQMDIENLTVSEGVTELDNYCFEFCPSLRTVTLPTTIRTIGTPIFAIGTTGEINIENIYMPVRIPPIVRGAPSEKEIPGLKVFVPEESYEDYMSDPSWSGSWGKYLVPYHFDSIDPPMPYESTDFSLDGTVTVLQSATSGNGIDLVLMGDAFSDRQLADGTYLHTMQSAADLFFGIEPYHSFRHLFNVYVVNVVSKSEDYSAEEDLALSSKLDFINGTISADFDKCREYAIKAISNERLDEATIVMVCNGAGLPIVRSCGTTYMFRRESTPETDYGSGLGIACMTTTPAVKYMVQHEAGGHGFGKLADEYITRAHGAVIGITDEEKEGYLQSMQFGWYKNVDFTDDPTQVKWSHFLADTRYNVERLGIYEGALAGYSLGVYRPSEESIMNGNNPIGYNAPSREAIYYRIHKLAFGSDWEYDYEKFVEYDQGAKNIRPTSQAQTKQAAKTYEVRDPLPVTNFNPDEWTITTMQ